MSVVCGYKGCAHRVARQGACGDRKCPRNAELATGHAPRVIVPATADEADPMAGPFEPSEAVLRWAPGRDSGLSRRKRKPANYRATIPPTIADAPVGLSGSTVAACSKARAEIEALDSSLDDDEVALIAMSLLRSEAVASSRIENLKVSNRGVALALHDPRAATRAAGEAAGNVQAMTAALRLAEGRPMSPEVIREIHDELLRGHDPHEIGGHLRTAVVWIDGATPVDATFVPPPPDEVLRLLSDLESFADRQDVEPIAKAAVLHAQFEAIHPFADGNGRVGRCLIHASLRRDGVTQRVTVPVSTLLLHERAEYFEALAAYQQRGDLDPWVNHFASAASDAVAVSKRLSTEIGQLREEWLEAAGQPREGSVGRRLVSLLPKQPVVDAGTVSAALGVSERTALRGLTVLDEAGVVTEVTKQKRNRVWAAVEVFDVLDEVQSSVTRAPGP